MYILSLLNQVVGLHDLHLGFINLRSPIHEVNEKTRNRQLIQSKK